MLNSCVRRVCILMLVCCCLQAAEDRKLCLWRIDNGEARVFLLGSIHAMKDEMYPLPGPITSAFEASEVVVFEVDLTRLNNREMSRVMAREGTYAPPASITDDLSPETVSLLDAYLDEAKISMDQIRYLKPWNLSLNIGVMELTRLGYKTELGLDQYLQKLAGDERKEIRELESFSEQIGILSSDPMDIQDLSLRVSLTERHRIQNDLEDMVSAWRGGDADRMYELTLESTRDYPRLQVQVDRLVLERNVRMAEKIRGYLGTSRNYLVVAGALHMGGPEGIINLLSEDFEVKQISW